MNAPLVTIRFEPMSGIIDPEKKAGFEPFERHWYHVPRIGDDVAIDMQGNGEEWVSGTVAGVIWNDHGATVLLHPR